MSFSEHLSVGVLFLILTWSTVTSAQVLSYPKLGIQVSSIGKADRGRLHLPSSIAGALVKGIIPGGVAADYNKNEPAEAQLLEDDVITKAAGMPVVDAPGYARQLQVAWESGRKSVLLLIYRSSTRSTHFVLLGWARTFEGVTASRPDDANRAEPSGATIFICERPIFKQERELYTAVDGTQTRTEEIAEAINYLRNQFCLSISESMLPQKTTKEVHVGDNCYQYAGPFRGETVYWGACLE